MFAPLIVSGANARPVESIEPDPGLDPTVLRSRVKVTNEFIEQAFDGSKNTTKLLLSYAFGNAARRDWKLQLDTRRGSTQPISGCRLGSPDALSQRFSSLAWKSSHR
jgi:hypothetical protein